MDEKELQEFSLEDIMKEFSDHHTEEQPESEALPEAPAVEAPEEMPEAPAEEPIEEAVEDFDKVAEKEPNNYDRLIQIYEVLSYYGETDAGKEYLQNALEKKDTKMSAYDKGRMYYYLEEYEQAYHALEEAKNGGGAEAYLYLGRAYEATGDYNYAANVYNSYLAKDKTNAEIYNQLGLCEMTRGEYQKALAAFQAGMNAENNNIKQTLAFNEIVAYEHLGEFQKATVLMQTYLQNYPDDVKALREYEFLSTR